MPEGPWTATAKLDHTAITVNGQAAGLVIYGQQNPNYFAKATLQFKTDVDPGTPGNQPGKWIERTLTTNGALNPAYGGNFPNSGALNAADERPVDPRALRRHERDHRVLARRCDVRGAGRPAGPRQRVRRRTA